MSFFFNIDRLTGLVKENYSLFVQIYKTCIFVNKFQIITVVTDIIKSCTENGEMKFILYLRRIFIHRSRIGIL